METSTTTQKTGRDTAKQPTNGTGMDRRRLLTLRDATASLGLRDKKVTMRLVKAGKLRALNIGQRIYITTASLDAFTK